MAGPVALTFPKGFVRVPRNSSRSRAVVALVSGGLESRVLIETLLGGGHAVQPLYVRSGLRWESTELAWLTRWLAHARRPRLHPLIILSMPLHDLYRAHWSLTGRGVPSHRSHDAAVYLPGRNVFLLAAAGIVAARTGCSTLVLGTLAGNPFGDATPAFFRVMAACLRQALGRPIRILAPLRQLTKAQLVRRFPGLPFHLTFSCLQPRGLRHCGCCNKCAERRRAFRTARAPDPTTYAR